VLGKSLPANMSSFLTQALGSNILSAMRARNKKAK
jgi:hypothetical protein